MDYQTVTDKTSKQYSLIQQSAIRDGLLYIDGYVLVALGSYYGDIGTKFILTFENGETLKVIKGDEKSNNHVVNGCYHKSNKSMIEFIVDTNTLSTELKVAGDLNELFKGKVVKIEKEN